MDWKIVTIGSYHVLLERIDADDKRGGWHVMISVFQSMTDRYDEWVTMSTPELARTFIERFDDLATRQFLTRAEATAKKKTVKSHA